MVVLETEKMERRVQDEAIDGLVNGLLFAVVLSACGKQSEESYAGQTESPKSREQTETSGTVTEEPLMDTESKESRLADGEDTQIQEGMAQR